MEVNGKYLLELCVEMYLYVTAGIARSMGTYIFTAMEAVDGYALLSL